jgi:hypothetical protein
VVSPFLKRLQAIPFQKFVTFGKVNSKAIKRIYNSIKRGEKIDTIHDGSTSD